jgi:hypothetical protein
MIIKNFIFDDFLLQSLLVNQDLVAKEFGMWLLRDRIFALRVAHVDFSR